MGVCLSQHPGLCINYEGDISKCLAQGQSGYEVGVLQDAQGIRV